MAVVEDLAGLPIFAGVEPAELTKLAKHAEEIDVPAGRVPGHPVGGDGRHVAHVLAVPR
jgi:hypothetical protein